MGPPNKDVYFLFIEIPRKFPPAEYQACLDDAALEDGKPQNAEMARVTAGKQLTNELRDWETELRPKKLRKLEFAHVINVIKLINIGR